MKTFFFTIFSLLSMALVAQETKKEKSYSNEIEVTSSIEDTWSLLSDVSIWKKWNSHIIDARLSGALVSDVRGTLVTSNSKVVNFKIIDFEKGKSYTVRHKLSSGILYIKRTVAPKGVGAKILIKVWFKGLSTKTFEKYMGRDYNLILEKELKRFQELLLN